jgi:hypothetical protein
MGGNGERHMTGVTAIMAGIAGGFNPSALFAAGEQGAWYDPSDISTLFQDTSGTMPVTAAGQSVARINDKSGRGNHATQSNSALQPLYQIDGNGRPFLLFDGSDDRLVTSSFTPSSDKAQIFAGLEKLSDANAGIVAETSTNWTLNAGSLILLAPLSASNSYASGARGNATSGVNQRADTGAVGVAPDVAVISATHDIAGDLSVIRRNGVTEATATGNKGTGNFNAYQFFIGRRSGTTGTAPFNGRMYGLVLRFGANLAAGQIDQTERWIAERTGVTIP